MTVVGLHWALVSYTTDVEIHFIHLPLELDLAFATWAIPKDLILEFRWLLRWSQISKQYCS